MCHSLQLVSGMEAGHKSEGGKEEDRGRAVAQLGEESGEGVRLKAELSLLNGCGFSILCTDWSVVSILSCDWSGAA